MIAPVTAYCLHTRTATGIHPHRGIVAGPRSQLGTWVTIRGVRYVVADVKPGGGYDIWMPSRHACRNFGRQRLAVQIEKRKGK
jgi:3D (Asp-Asp-Asp) domain-containing protein